MVRTVIKCYLYVNNGVSSKHACFHCAPDTCINCGACSKTCNMQVDPTVNPNSAECIRCGECVKACPVNALEFEFLGKRRENQEYNSTEI